MEVSHPWGDDGADGRLVTHRHEVDQEHTLRLYAVTLADAGTYVCTAQSQLGTAAATALLRIEGQWWLPWGTRVTWGAMQGYPFKKAHLKGIHPSGFLQGDPFKGVCPR